MIDNLLNKSNEELCEWFRAEILEANPDPEWERRLKEYHDNIECDFQEEWSKKRFKWFFKKRRQTKLRYQVSRRYTAPVFWLIEDVVNDMLVSQWQNSEFFDKFVDIKETTNV